MTKQQIIRELKKLYKMTDDSLTTLCLAKILTKVKVNWREL